MRKLNNLDDNGSPRFPAFKFLSQLPRDKITAIIRPLQPQVEDVDSWNIAMSPEYFLRNFAMIHTFVILTLHFFSNYVSQTNQQNNT